MQIIYEPKGAAGEYAELALNIYQRCTHGCKYCYAPGATRQSRERFHSSAAPKKNVIQRLTADCRKLAALGDPPEILLSFIGDPYQPEEMHLQLTSRCIEVLIEHNLRFTVLTKGGNRAVRDFGRMQSYAKCSFGVSLVWANDMSRHFWEPNASTIYDRIRSLRLAKQLGIRTWVSLEPVIDPAQALMVVNLLHEHVDHWKAGKINHHPAIEKEVDWIDFRERITGRLGELDANFYIKRSLSEL